MEISELFFSVNLTRESLKVAEAEALLKKNCKHQCINREGARLDRKLFDAVIFSLHKPCNNSITCKLRRSPLAASDKIRKSVIYHKSVIAADRFCD